MADRNISIRISANVGAYNKSIRGMAAQTQKFAASLDEVNRKTTTMGNTAGMTGKNYNMMARGMGVAKAQTDRLSFAMKNGQTAFAAAAKETGFFNKGLATMKTLAVGAASAFAGFLAVHAIINTITKGVRESISAFMDFDAALNEAFAVLGNVSDVMRKDMGDAAREMAKQSTFSAAEVASGFYDLVSTGFAAKDAIAAIPAVTAFAQAGMFNLATATDLLTDAQTALGLTIRDNAEQNFINMVRVSDVLVEASIQSTATVEQLADALTNKAAASARILGKDVEETTAVLAAFADQGVKGQVAGTQLNIVWRDLQTRAIQNADAFAQFGLSVFDTQGNMKNTADIIGQLEGILSGMNNEMQRATLMQLGFQDRSVASIQTLLGMSDSIRRMELDLRNAGGTTERVAKRQLESLSAKLKILKSNLLDFAIEGGYRLVEFATTASRVIGPTIKNIVKIIGTMWDAFKSSAGTAIVATLLGIGAALKGVFMVLEPLTKLLSENEAIIKGLTVAYLANKAAAIGTIAYQKASAVTTSMMTAATQRLVASKMTEQAALLRSTGLYSEETIAMMLNITAKSGVVAATGRVGTAYTLMAAKVKAATTSMAGFKAAMTQSTTGYANLAMAGVVAAVAIKSSWDKTGQAMRDQAQGLTDQYNTTTLKGIESARNALYEQAAAANEVSRSHDNAWGKLRGGIELMTPWGNSVQEAHEKVIAYTDEVKRMDEMYARMNPRLQRFRDEFGASDEVIQKAADSLGIDLTRELELTDDEIKEINTSLGQQRSAYMQAGNEAQNFGEVSVGELEAISDAAEETRDNLIKSFASFKDIGSSIEASTHEAMDTLSIYEDLYSERQEMAEDAASESRSAAIQAAQDNLRTLRRHKTDASKEEKDMWTARIREAEDGLTRLKRANEQAVMANAPDIYDWAGAIQEQAALRRQFIDAQEQAWAAGAPVGMMDAIKQMDPEQGLALLNQFLGGIYQSTVDFQNSMAGIPPELQNMFPASQSAAEAFVEPFVGMFDGLEEELGWEEFSGRVHQKMLDAQAFQDDIQSLLSLENVDRQFVLTLAQDPANASMINELVEMGNGAVSEINRVASETNTTAEAEAVDSMQHFATILDTYESGSTTWRNDVLGYMRQKNLTFEEVEKIMNENLPKDASDAARENVQGLLTGLNNDVAQLEEDLNNEWDTWVNRVNNTHMEASVEVTATFTGNAAGFMTGSTNMDASEVGIRTVYNEGLARRRNNNPRPANNTGGNKAFADGGIMKPSDGMAVFNEPGTGGEAFIPLGKAKRGVALPVLRRVADMFGVGLAEYANGGIYSNRSTMGGTPSSYSAQPQVIVVESSSQSSSETRFQFGDIKASDFNDILRQATRQKRLANLTGKSNA